MSPELQVSDDPAGGAVERIAAAVRAGGHVVLTGGSTPRNAYERLAKQDLDWSRTTLWFTDERCVAPDHEQSNYRMAKAALLERIAPLEVHRIQGELGPAEGAAAYERELQDAFGGEPPRFDLMLLGIGPDAHICSLFPSDPALGERERFAVGVETPGMAPLVSRVTLTLPVVNASQELLALVSGEDKAEAVARAFSGREDPRAPASLVHPEGTFTALLDPAAAAQLEGRA